MRSTRTIKIRIKPKLFSSFFYKLPYTPITCDPEQIGRKNTQYIVQSVLSYIYNIQVKLHIIYSVMIQTQLRLVPEKRTTKGTVNSKQICRTIDTS